MADFAVSLTPLHFLYLIGVITVLTTMILRKDTPLVCIVFLFLIGLVACGTLTGAIQSVFASILYAAKEFMEIIATIALITALSKCLSDLGSDRIMATRMYLTGGSDPHPVKRTVKKYKVFLGQQRRLLSTFYAARYRLCFSNGVKTPKLRCTRRVL